MDESINDYIMTSEDVADYLKVAVTTVYRWVREKAIPCHRVGKYHRFYKSEIDAWIKQGNSDQKKTS